VTRSTAQILRGVAAILASRYLVRFLGLAKGLLVARLLAPTQYGYYGLLGVFLGYGSFSDAGIFGGLTRALPLHASRGEAHRAEALSRSALSMVLLLAALAAALSVAILSWRTPALHPALPALAAAMIAQQVFKYTTVLLRAHSRFREAALGFTLVQGLEIAFVVALVFPFRLPGVIAGQALAFAAAALLMIRVGRLFPGWGWDPRGAYGLARSGLPLVLSTMTFLFLQTADRLLIAGILDAAALGHYMIGVFCASFLLYIPQTVEYVLFPALRERVAALGPGETLPARLVETPTRLLALALPPITAAVYLSLPLVTLALPDYAPGLPAASVLVLGTFFLSVVTGPSSFLVAVDRVRPLLLAQAVAVIVNVVLDVAALRLGYGIAGVAWATAAGYALYSAGALLALHRVVGGTRARLLRFATVLYGPYVVVLALAVLAARLVPAPAGRELPAVALRLLLLGVLLAPAVWLLERRSGALREVLTLFRLAVRP
jgi:O-antigen/teichoic acid export membrane protein